MFPAFSTSHIRPVQPKVVKLVAPVPAPVRAPVPVPAPVPAPAPAPVPPKIKLPPNYNAIHYFLSK
jgi:hypothetical protein